MGSTKEGFNKLTQKKLDYDSERENMQRQLAPVQSVINHVSKMHGLQPQQDQMMQDPNDPNAMQDPNDPNNMMQDEDGIPANMNQTVGKMNSNRPSLAGTQPGVAPGDGQTVRPPKMGQASPGGPGARNSPQPGNSPYNKQAAPPKGSKQLPGAKGPGDSKVANKAKTAQSNSGRAIKVNVTASSSIPGARTNLASSFGLGMLKGGGVRSSSRTILSAADLGDNDLRNMCQEALKDKMGIPSSSGGCGLSSSPWITEIYPLQSYFVYNSEGKTYRQDFKLTDGEITLKGEPIKVKLAYVKAAKNKMKAGPEALNDKAATTGSDLSYNPKFNAAGHKKGCMCAGCKSMNAGGPGSGRKKGSGQGRKEYVGYNKTTRQPDFQPKSKTGLQDAKDYSKREGLSKRQTDWFTKQIVDR